MYRYASTYCFACVLGLARSLRQQQDPTQPFYTWRNETTDPGRALVTGKWGDIGKFKGPILGALATRAPYFQNQWLERAVTSLKALEAQNRTPEARLSVLEQCLSALTWH
jgi:hypothetical protein